MDEWMEIYAAANRGELAVTFPDDGSPVLESGPSPPAVETEDEARSRPADEQRPASPPPERPPPWEVDSLAGLDRPGALSESLRKMGLM
jgi:hypothetical protein